MDVSSADLQLLLAEPLPYEACRQGNDDDWFQEGGAKTLKNGARRTHYRCSRFRDKKCEARKVVLTTSTNEMVVSFQGEHNHSPPIKHARLHAVLSVAAKTAFETNASPIVVHQHLLGVAEANGLPRSSLPTINALRQAKYRGKVLRLSAMFPVRRRCAFC